MGIDLWKVKILGLYMGLYKDEEDKEGEGS